MHKKNSRDGRCGVARQPGGRRIRRSRQETTVFEPVIVTAQKREQSIYEVPVAISAFTADTIEQAGHHDLTDIGKFVPNLNVTGFSAGHTSSANPFIRGIGLQDHLITTDPGVGVYVDGVYLGPPGRPELEPREHRARRGAARPAGHAVRAQLDRRRDQHHHARSPATRTAAGYRSRRASRGRLNADFYSNMAFSDQLAFSVTGAFQHRDGLGRFVKLENPRKEVGEMEDVSGARRAQVVADRPPVVPADRRRQRRRRRPASLRHADRRGAERRRVRRGLPQFGHGARTRTTTIRARSRRPR